MGTTDRRGCLVPKHLDSRKLGTENNSLNFATKWQDRPSQTLQGIESLNFVTEAAGRTVVGTTARHRLRNPDWVGFLLKVLRGVLDYSCL